MTLFTILYKIVIKILIPIYYIIGHGREYNKYPPEPTIIQREETKNLTEMKEGFICNVNQVYLQVWNQNYCGSKLVIHS